MITSLLHGIGGKHPRQLLVHAEFVAIGCHFYLVINEHVENLLISLPVEVTETHSLNEIAKWRRWLNRNVPVHDEGVFDVGAVLQKLVNSISIPAHKGLTEWRHLVLV